MTQISLQDFLREMKSRKIALIIIFIISMAGCLIYTQLLSKPLYRTTIEIQLPSNFGAVRTATVLKDLSTAHFMSIHDKKMVSHKVNISKHDASCVCVEFSGEQSVQVVSFTNAYKSRSIKFLQDYVTTTLGKKEAKQIQLVKRAIDVDSLNKLERKSNLYASFVFSMIIDVGYIMLSLTKRKGK